MFTIIHKLFVLIPCLLGVLVDAYPEPGNCTGACWAHDPSVMQRASDGAYFRFSTGGGIQIWKSLSIVGPWIIEGYVMPNGSSIDLVGNTDLWVRLLHQRGFKNEAY
jgi:arabinan endo-1,5-alpha-L-arabinosidase